MPLHLASRVASLLVAALLLLLPLSSQAKSYVVVRIEGVINPIKVRQVSRALATAERNRSEFLLVTLDTPGGLVTSMEEIVTALTNAPLPVVAFVTPKSAQATSAGAFILLAADLAAMAPSTRVGAAHPVAQGKPLEGALDAKATNSLVSLAKSLAERRNRPLAQAEAMVRESTSYTALEAQKAKLVELLVSDEPALLKALDGREARPGRRLHTRGLTRLKVDATFVDRTLDMLANPTLTALFMSLGGLAIIYELATPGIGAGGALGALMLVLGLLGSSVVPLAWSAIILFVIGIVALALEVKVPTHGVLGGIGVVSLAVGTILLVDPSAYFGATQRVRLSAALPILVGAIIGFLLLARVVRRALAAPTTTGIESLVGHRGSARTTLGIEGSGTEGQVLVDGARWSAYAENSEIQVGDQIEVVAIFRKPTRLLVRRRNEG